MSKGVVFVVVYSLVIAILFCVFCYLITTVEPPPLVNFIKNDSRRYMDLDVRIISYSSIEFFLRLSKESDEASKVSRTDKNNILNFFFVVNCSLQIFQRHHQGSIKVNHFTCTLHM